MKIVVIGGNGMLGSDICSLLNAHYSVISFDSTGLDISSPDSIQSALGPLNDVSHVINCAAYTKVDDCETNRDLAFKVNGDGPGNLATYCQSRSLPLIHFSTDYVFDGKKEAPYIEDDFTNPINVYGESKLDGERNIISQMSNYYIFRVQWLYGSNGNNFIKSITKLASERSELSIVDDQWGSPTWTKDIAKAVLRFIKESPDYGIYNFANSNYCNWYEFAKTIVALQQLKCVVKPQPSSAYPVPAKRPSNSRLDLTKFCRTAVEVPRSWQDACKQFILPA